MEGGWEWGSNVLKRGAGEQRDWDTYSTTSGDQYICRRLSNSARSRLLIAGNWSDGRALRPSAAHESRLMGEVPAAL